MDDLVLVKQSGGLWKAATDADLEEGKRFKVGSAVRFKPTKLKGRSLKYHNMYFGGLLKLTLQYWEPSGGFVSMREEGVIWQFANYLARASGDSSQNNVIAEVTKEYLEELEAHRSSSFEMPHKTLDMLHEWVVEKAGYYDLIITPEGIKKRRKSINFNAMDGDKFHKFYKSAFNVCWSFVLSRKFASEEEAQNVVDQLSSMG